MFGLRLCTEAAMVGWWIVLLLFFFQLHQSHALFDLRACAEVLKSQHGDASKVLEVYGCFTKAFSSFVHLQLRYRPDVDVFDVTAQDPVLDFDEPVSLVVLSGIDPIAKCV